MIRLTGVATDADLPEIHHVLAKSKKGQGLAILQAAVQNRALVSNVALQDGSLPLVTTKVADEVFRSFQPMATGLTFAQGLTPFAMVCEGHAEAAKVQEMAKKADMAERGSGLGLADAERLVATDVRFPTTPQTAAANDRDTFSVEVEQRRNRLAMVN